MRIPIKITKKKRKKNYNTRQVVIRNSRNICINYVNFKLDPIQKKFPLIILKGE